VAGCRPVWLNIVEIMFDSLVAAADGTRGAGAAGAAVAAKTGSIPSTTTASPTTTYPPEHQFS